jgi:hypothetical protein
MATRRWVLAAIVLVATALPGTAGAGTGIKSSGAYPPREIFDIEAERNELGYVDVLLAGAARGSPAHLRLREEHDRLTLAIRVSGELDYLGLAFSQATPGSPAQFRVREELDRLREALRRIDRWRAAPPSRLP